MGPGQTAALDEKESKRESSVPPSPGSSHPAPDDAAHREEKKDEPLEEPQKSYRTILEQEVATAEEEMKRPALALLLSGLSAGLDIGFGPLTMVVLGAILSPTLPKPVVEVLKANAYAVGFIFVVLGRSALFTEHTTSAVLPVLTRRASVGELLRLWGFVLFGNIVGAIAFSAFAAALVPSLVEGSTAQFAEMARRTASASSWVMFLSAIMAGWLMGLLSWLVIASRETVAQFLSVWVTTMVIGLAGFHHSIAGSAEILMGVMLGQGATVGDYLRFFVLAVPGNAIGGAVFVALLKWGHIQQTSG